jgi:hypothetical protein
MPACRRRASDEEADGGMQTATERTADTVGKLLQ